MCLFDWSLDSQGRLVLGCFYDIKSPPPPPAPPLSSNEESAAVFKIISVFHGWRGGSSAFHAHYNVVCSSCDPAAHRPCHLVLCPPLWGHLVSHMEGTGWTPQLAASSLKHSFCLCVPQWMDHCPGAKRDEDKIFSVSIPVMFNQSLRQIYEL